MKSPFTNTHNPKPTQLSYNTTTTTPPPCYEPTSVLDIRRSPSPVAAAPPDHSVLSFPSVAGVFLDDPSLHWDDLPLLPSDDWDSITMTWSFNEKDDSTPILNPNPPHLPLSSDPSSFPDFISSAVFSSDQNQSHDSNPLVSIEGNHDFNCVQLDQLIRAAECFELSQLQLSQVILERLNQRLQSPDGKPLQRAAFYFKEALQSLLSGSNRIPNSSTSATFHSIRAYKALCEISPIAPFANFTTNQALLESLNGSRFIHAIDFEIGLGLQWASFMQELANRSKDYNLPLPTLRVTAVLPEESLIEAKLIKDNLYQLAEELGIRFQIAFLSVRSFETAMFNEVRFVEGETIAVNLSPAILGHLASSDSISRFFGLIRRIGPQIVLFVDTEGWRETGPPSFRRNFINGLELYSSLLESLDAANTRGLDFVRLIERYLVRPKIFAAVSAATNRVPSSSWWELFVAAGMSPVGFSEFTESQAECLVRRAQARGFQVAKRQTSILLCWHDRELLATSAWRC